MKLRIAVVSDLHCHPKMAEKEKSDSYFLSDGPRVPASENPLESLRQAISRLHITADVLVLPGDFTNRANLHGYIVGVQSVRELARHLSAQTIVATLGNHDVDSRDLHKFGAHYLGEQLFGDFPMESELQKLSFFKKGYAIVNTTDADFLVVNSVLNATDETKARRGQVTNAQLQAITKEISTLKAGKLRICVSHHHPIQHEMLDLGSEDLMEGGDPLIEELEKAGFHFFIHGHKHHPRLRYTTGGVARFPVFASGSLSAVISGKFSRSCRNTFHVIEIEMSAERARGVITSYELDAKGEWIPSTFQSAGIPHQSGFGADQPIEELVASIVSACGTSPYKVWAEIAGTVPALRFLTPSELVTLSTKLGARGYALNPIPQAPILIGATLK